MLPLPPRGRRALGVMLWNPPGCLRSGLPGESCCRLLRVFTAQTTACGPEGRLRRTCVCWFYRLSSLCWLHPASGAPRWISFCLRHWGRIPSPSVDSFYFYGKCLHSMSSPAAVKWTLALFPAKLSDLLSAFLRFSWIHVWGDPANENAGGHVSGLFVFSFYCFHKPELLACDGSISALSLSLKRRAGKCVHDGKLQQCAGDLWRVIDKFGQDESSACWGALLRIRKGRADRPT